MAVGEVHRQLVYCAASGALFGVFEEEDHWSFYRQPG